MAVKKCKASTCLAYRHELSRQRDANGDRIKGLREIDTGKADIDRRIYQFYAGGRPASSRNSCTTKASPVVMAANAAIPPSAAMSPWPTNLQQ